MACLTPITLYRPERNMKDNHTDIVPCGRCPACLRRRIHMWSFRLRKEQEVSISSSFITLTYDDEHLPTSDNGLMTLDKRDHQLFMKKLRKHLHNNRFKYNLTPNIKLKYYAVGEYGGETNRPHFHSILFNLPDKLIVDETIIESIWGKGRIQVAVCNDKTINYVAGYVNKRLNPKTQDELDDRQIESSLMSKGLGKNFLSKQTTKFYQNLMQPYIIEKDGVKLPMPRYYRHKIYSDYKQRLLSQKSKEYAENNYQYRDAYHELEHKKQQFKQFKKSQKPKRKNI